MEAVVTCFGDTRNQSAHKENQGFFSSSIQYHPGDKAVPEVVFASTMDRQ
jgi:hypothetical protein